MKKAVFAILILLVVVAAAWAYFFFFAAPQGEVSLEFTKPETVYIGQSFKMEVSVANYGSQSLQDAKLSLLLPRDVLLAGSSEDQRVKEVLMGNISPGSTKQQAFNLIVTRGADSLKHISAVLAYRSAGSSGSYEVSAEVDITVGQSSAGLNFTLPEKVFSGEKFNFDIEYQNNSAQSLRDITVQVVYPQGFQFERATLQPTEGNNSWKIANIERGKTGKITVTGSLTGSASTLAGFSGSILAKISGETYEISSQEGRVDIATSPLAFRVQTKKDIVMAGESVQYELYFKNNSGVVMENINVRATLSGEMYDFARANSDGSFNSVTNTFTWNPATTRKLTTLEPGAEKSVTVTIPIKNTFPIQRVSDKNFSLRLQAQVETATVPSGTTAAKSLSLAQHEIKVAGAIEVDAKAFYRDAASGIVNSGPFPPRVNRATRYTIHWIIKNYSTDTTKVKVSAYLQSGSKFTGMVTSTIAAKPEYNSASGEVVWNIGNLTAGKGIIGQPVEAVFQIEHMPAVNQEGARASLVGETSVIAFDSFTGTELTDKDAELTTDLPDDASLQGVEKRIQP